MLYKLFFEFLKIGAFSFGGGLATLPYIYELAEKTEWFSIIDVTNMVTISQITPGPLASNMATYVGFKLNGVLGAIIATISFTLPAICFISIVYKLVDRFKGDKKIEFILRIIRSSTLAIIIVSSFTIFKIAFLNDINAINLTSIISNINYKCIILAIFLIISTKRIKISTMQCMIFSALIGIIFKF